MKVYRKVYEAEHIKKRVKIQLFSSFLRSVSGAVITGGVDCLNNCLFIVNIHSQQGFSNNPLLCKSSLQ